MPKRGSSAAAAVSPGKRAAIEPVIPPLRFIVRRPSPTSMAGQQYDAHSLTDIFRCIERLPPKALIVLDLDNTVMEPAQTLGSDQWFDAYFQHLLSKYNGDKQRAYDEIIPIYNYVHEHSAVFAVEANTVAFIRKLLEKHNVIALTTRGKELAAATIRQIQSLGIRFAVSPDDNGHHIFLDRMMENCPQSYAKDSVIFAGGRSKADCLKKYLEAMHIEPRAIPYLVFIDDKKHHVENIARCAQELGVPSTCFHYRHLEHKIASVDLRIAEVQFKMHKTFGVFVNDKVALSIVDQLVTQGAVLDTAEAHAARVLSNAAAAAPSSSSARPGMAA